ncbi:MAG: hypothetical protein AVO33_03075 [delta proteobacterium ML8_F1]|nr:MAG: hypothetical protein AVO33_03075 [delta proteobacterium ML8_F1]
MVNPVLLIALPLLLAFVSIVFKAYKNNLLVFGTLLNAGLVLTLNKGQYIIGGFQPPFGINLVLDDFALTGILIINGLFLVITLMSLEKLEGFASVLLVALAGLNGLVLTGDLFNLFVFLEITAITAYILSSASKEYRYAFNYLVLGTLGSGLYLFGLIVLYAVFGTLNMADLSVKMAAVDASQLVLPSLLIFIGLAVEVKILPFNGWVKGVYSGTNSLVGPLFASVYAAGMLFVFGRIFAQVIPLGTYLRTSLVVLGALTLLAGEVAALSKTRIREILLYSSIGQSGLIAALFLSGLVFVAVMQLVNNALSKAILFTVAGQMADSTGTDEGEELQGAFLEHKIAGVGFTIAALSLIGLPLFYGFISKMNLLFGIFYSDNYWLPVVILLGTVIEGTYMVRLLVKLWTPGDEGIVSEKAFATERPLTIQSSKVMGIVVLSVVLLIGGLLPAVIQDNLTDSGSLLDEVTPAYLFDLKGGQ